MPKVLKQVARPGNYWVTGPAGPYPFTITAEDCRHWHRSGKEMLAERFPIRVPLEHQDWAEPLHFGDEDERKAKEVLFNKGFTTDFVLDRDNSVWAELDIPDAELAGRLETEIKYVSPRIIPAFIDGHGKVWKNVIGHIALTPQPVDHRQKPFGEGMLAPPVSLSMLGGDSRPLDFSLQHPLDAPDPLDPPPGAAQPGDAARRAWQKLRAKYPDRFGPPADFALSADQRARVLALLEGGATSAAEIAAQTGVSVGSVASMKAHMTMRKGRAAAPAAVSAAPAPPAAAPPAPAPEAPAAPFHEQVLEGAKQLARGQNPEQPHGHPERSAYGGNKVFVSKLYEHLKPRLGGMSLDEFKAKVNEHAGRGQLEVSRADMVQAMHPETVKASEIDRMPGNADFMGRPKYTAHFVTIPNLPGNKPWSPEGEREAQAQKPAPETLTPPAEGDALTVGTDEGIHEQAAELAHVPKDEPDDDEHFRRAMESVAAHPELQHEEVQQALGEKASKHSERSKKAWETIRRKKKEAAEAANKGAEQPAAAEPEPRAAESFDHPSNLSPDNLPQAFEHFKKQIADSDPKLSPARAGELAAARMVNAIRDYDGQLEDKIRQGGLTPEEEKFYDRMHVDEWKPAAELMKLSGSRTLISDQDEPHAKRALHEPPAESPAAAEGHQPAKEAAESPVTTEATPAPEEKSTGDLVVPKGGTKVGSQYLPGGTKLKPEHLAKLTPEHLAFIREHQPEETSAEQFSDAAKTIGKMQASPESRVNALERMAAESKAAGKQPKGPFNVHVGKQATFTPHDTRHAEPVTGEVVEEIKGVTGTPGWVLHAPTPDDPSRTVRVWSDKGAISGDAVEPISETPAGKHADADAAYQAGVKHAEEKVGKDANDYTRVVYGLAEAMRHAGHDVEWKDLSGRWHDPLVMMPANSTVAHLGKAMEGRADRMVKADLPYEARDPKPFWYSHSDPESMQRSLNNWWDSDGKKARDLADGWRQMAEDLKAVNPESEAAKGLEEKAAGVEKRLDAARRSGEVMIEAARAKQDEEEAAKREARKWDRDPSSVQTKNVKTAGLIKELTKFDKGRINGLATAKNTGWATNGYFAVKIPEHEREKIVAAADKREAAGDVARGVPAETIAKLLDMRPHEVAGAVAGARTREGEPEYLLRSQDGKKNAVVNANYFELIRSRYPDAQFFLPHKDGNQILFSSGGDKVAMLMPITRGGDVHEFKGEPKNFSLGPRATVARAKPFSEGRTQTGRGGGEAPTTHAARARPVVSMSRVNLTDPLINPASTDRQLYERVLDYLQTHVGEGESLQALYKALGRQDEDEPRVLAVLREMARRGLAKETEHGWLFTGGRDFSAQRRIDMAADTGAVKDNDDDADDVQTPPDKSDTAAPAAEDLDDGGGFGDLNTVKEYLAHFGIVLPEDTDENNFLEHLQVALHALKGGAEAAGAGEQQDMFAKATPEEAPATVNMSAQIDQLPEPLKGVVKDMSSRLQWTQGQLAAANLAAVCTKIDGLAAKGKVAPALAEDWKKKIGQKSMSLVTGKDPVVQRVLDQMDMAEQVPDGTFWSEEEKTKRRARAEEPERPEYAKDFSRRGSMSNEFSLEPMSPDQVDGIMRQVYGANYKPAANGGGR